MQTDQEKQNIKELVLNTSEIEGDCIEIGVFQGYSALLIEEYRNKDKKLYLIDTFEGLKDASKYDPSSLVNCTFSTSEELVQYLFRDKTNYQIIKGFFPHDVETQFDTTVFSFVHLDVDTYISTLISLWYLYSKVSTGGVILFHDYNSSSTNVRRAVDLFMKDKPEKIIVLGTSQAFIVKQ